MLFLLNNLDRNQTDLHRFKPSSRAILINEQLNHLYLLQHKDMTGLLVKQNVTISPATPKLNVNLSIHSAFDQILLGICFFPLFLRFII